MVVRWLMANAKAIEERTRDGKTYYVPDRREGVSRGRRPVRWQRYNVSNRKATTPLPNGF